MGLPTKREHIARWNRLPVYTRAIVQYPSIRRFWLPYTPAVLGLYFTILAFFAPILAIPALAFIGLSVWYFKRYLLKIEPKDIDGDGDDEPVYAQLLYLGDRTPETQDEGLVWNLPGGKWEERSKEQFNEDVTIDETLFRLDTLAGAVNKSFYDAVAFGFNTPAPSGIKPGGTCKVELGLTFERDWVDGHAVLDYDEVGETKGALNIILDSIEADLREIGRRLNWVQAAFATDLISAHIICKLTGVTEFEYNGEKKKIFDNPSPEFIDAFLREVRINGLPYVHGLGLRIRRAEVKSVDPVGELKKAAESAAVELLRREGLLQDAQAIADATKKLQAEINSDGSLSKKDLVDILLVNDQNARVEKRILQFNAKEIEGMTNVLKEILKNWKG